MRSTSGRSRASSAACSATAACSPTAADSTDGRLQRPVGQGGRHPGPGPDGEHAHPCRPAPLVRAGGEQRPPGRHRRATHGLRRVDQERHAAVAAQGSDGLDRLDSADLVARADQAGQRCVRGERFAVRRDVHPAEGVDRHRHPVRGRVQHGGVLDRRVHHAGADPAPGAGRAGDRAVHRRRTAGGEGDLVGACTEDRGDPSRGRSRAATGRGGPRRRGGSGRPSRRRARPAAPRARRCAGGARRRRRGAPEGAAREGPPGRSRGRR